MPKRVGGKRTTKSKRKRKVQPGSVLETVVQGIQQKMDPNSTVTRNEWLTDRVGNRRQYDIVIRGQFAGRSVLGIIECKDHSRKKGPADIEAFAKKTENLGANVRLMVSRRGFTKQALKLAQHEHIGCLSLLPESREQSGFTIGEMWYGVVRQFTTASIIVNLAGPVPMPPFSTDAVKYDNKPVVNWFMREFIRTVPHDAPDGPLSGKIVFDAPQFIEINGGKYTVRAIGCTVNLATRKKRRWVKWTGEAFYDWHIGGLVIPAGAQIVSGAVETDPSAWPDYDGSIPEATNPAGGVGVTMFWFPKWDASKDAEVPDLERLEPLCRNRNLFERTDQGS